MGACLVRMTKHSNADSGRAHGLLTLVRVAARFDCSERTVWRWIQLGRLRGVRLGGRWFVHEDDVAVFEKPQPVAVEHGEEGGHD